MTFWSNTGEGLRRQPDNYYGLKVFCFVLIIYTVLQWVTGLRSLLIFCPIYLFCQYTKKQAQAGHLEVSDKSGMTVEGLQEYYDEACLAVINNKWAASVLCSSTTSPKKVQWRSTMARCPVLLPRQDHLRRLWEADEEDLQGDRCWRSHPDQRDKSVTISPTVFCFGRSSKKWKPVSSFLNVTKVDIRVLYKTELLVSCSPFPHSKLDKTLIDFSVFVSTISQKYVFQIPNKLEFYFPGSHEKSCFCPQPDFPP